MSRKPTLPTSIVTAAALAMIPVGCKSSDSKSTAKEFLAPSAPPADVGEAALHMPKLAGYQYQARELYTTIKHPKDGNTSFTDYDVLLPGLTGEQCESLRQAFAIAGDGGGENAYRFQSDIACIAGRDYRLEDFLPPLVGALKGKSFNEEGQSFFNGIESNCWNAAYEFARLNRSEFTVFNAPVEIDSLFRRGDMSKTILEEAYCAECQLTPAMLADKVKSEAMTGDIILLRLSSGMPAHGFIYIDGDLIFEKSNPGWYETYRFNKLINVIKRYEYGAGSSSTGATLTLLRPAKKFAPAQNDPIFRYAGIDTVGSLSFIPVPLTKGSDNRYSLGIPVETHIASEEVRKFGQLETGGYTTAEDAYYKPYDFDKPITFRRCPGILQSIFNFWPSSAATAMKSVTEFPADSYTIDCAGTEIKALNLRIRNDSKRVYRFKATDLAGTCLVTADVMTIQFPQLFPWQQVTEDFDPAECGQVKFWRIQASSSP